jgi:hypothetical protein
MLDTALQGYDSTPLNCVVVLDIENFISKYSSYIYFFPEHSISAGLYEAFVVVRAGQNV